MNSQTTEQIILNTKGAYPRAGIRVTGRGRTIKQQAAFLARQIRQNRAIFTATYGTGRQYTRDMLAWHAANPAASEDATIEQFVMFLNEGNSRGERISNHVGNDAIDISWPVGTPQDLDKIEAHITNLGARVIREKNAAGGPHWHIDQQK